MDPGYNPRREALTHRAFQLLHETPLHLIEQITEMLEKQYAVRNKPADAGYSQVGENYTTTGQTLGAASASQILHDIGWAIKQMDKGSRVQRAGWNGKGMWLALQTPELQSKMSLPYIYMKTSDDKLVPWLASQTDLLATDWSVTL